MTFLWPEALWLLALLPALGAAYVALLRRRHKRALPYPSLGIVRAAAAAKIRPHVPAMLFLAAIAAVLAAIARPAVLVSPPLAQRTVILAIDASLSMKAADVAPSRLAIAKAAARVVVNGQPRDVRVGVISFGYHADLMQSPTSSHADALAAIDAIELRNGSGVGTGLLAALILLFPEAGIGAGLDIFAFRAPPGYHEVDSPPPREKPPPVAPGSDPASVVVLLTDGDASAGYPVKSAAKAAADRGVRVHTVGVGTPGGGIVELSWGPENVAFDAQPLKEISGLTRGEYFHADNADGIEEVYRGLRAHAVFASRDMEITVLLAAVAVILLLASAALSLLWFTRLE